MYTILKRLNEWNQDSKETLENADSILEKNQQSIDNIVEINSQMTQEDLKEFSEANNDFVQAIIIKQKELIQFIKEQSIQLEQQLGQMNHKSKAVKLYRNNEKSLFLDRDM